jgi:hypothetical protein
MRTLMRRGSGFRFATAREDGLTCCANDVGPELMCAECRALVTADGGAPSVRLGAMGGERAPRAVPGRIEMTTTSSRRDGIQTSAELREAMRVAVAGGQKPPTAAEVRAAAADRLYTSEDLRALQLASISGDRR